MIETVGTLLLGILVGLMAARGRNRKTPECPHCLHWMFSNASGTTTFQFCCKCGVVHGVHLVGALADLPFRPRDHGQHMQYLEMHDDSNVRRFPGAG